MSRIGRRAGDSPSVGFAPGGFRALPLGSGFSRETAPSTEPGVDPDAVT